MKDSPIRYRFFLGMGCAARFEDEIVLPVDDSYARLPWKVQAALRWALAIEPKITHMFKTDADTEIRADDLLHSDFESHDYVGNFWDGKPEPTKRKGTYAMGAGYWLSRASAEKVVAATIDDTVSHHGEYFEDMFVGKVLESANRHHEDRYGVELAGRSHGPIDGNFIIMGNSYHNRVVAPPDFIPVDGLDGEKLELAKKANEAMNSGNALLASQLLGKMYRVA